MTPQPIATRAEINRQNAKHSTGPNTPEGKNRIRHNAVKHNLSGKDLLLEPAETDAYNELHRRLRDCWKPVTEEETDVLLAIIDAQWRLNGIPALHINLLALATLEHMDQYEEHAATPESQRSMARIAGYRANMRLFEQFSRHEGRLQRTIAALTSRLMNLLDYRENEEKQEAAARSIKQGQQIVASLVKPPPTKQSQSGPQTSAERIEAALNSSTESPAPR